MTNIELIKQELERMRKINRKAFEAEHIKSDIFHGRAQAINHIFEFIDSLPKEEEIDLDEEITKYWKDISSLYGAVGKEITRFDFDDVCKYFYELGKNGK